MVSAIIVVLINDLDLSKLIDNKLRILLQNLVSFNGYYRIQNDKNIGRSKLRHEYSYRRQQSKKTKTQWTTVTELQHLRQTAKHNPFTAPYGTATVQWQQIADSLTVAGGLTRTGCRAKMLKLLEKMINVQQRL